MMSGKSIDRAFFDIQRISGQEYLSQSTSPDGTYTVTAYLNNGGATTDFAVLGRLKNNRTGKERNIYWQYHCSKAEMQWINNETIRVNDKELNVINEIYDYRRSKSSMHAVGARREYRDTLCERRLILNHHEGRVCQCFLWGEHRFSPRVEIKGVTSMKAKIQQTLWVRIALLTLETALLLYVDFWLHEKLAHISFKNYAWLGYFRYGSSADLILSLDVVIGLILFAGMVAYVLLKGRMKAAILVGYPIVAALLHVLTLR